LKRIKTKKKGGGGFAQTRGKAAKLLQYFISNLSFSKWQSAEDYLSAEDSTLKLTLLEEDHATHAKTLVE
jgi:hypothetical protein